MVSRSERSSTPGRRSAPKSYHFDADVFPAVIAVTDLLHSGDLRRFAEDAMVEAIYDLELLNVPRAPLMPRAEALTTPAAVAGALLDVESLMTAMAGRLASQRRVAFSLRDVTFHHAIRALETFPRQKKYAWPARERHEASDASQQVRFPLHPRLEMAMEQWIARLATESARAGNALALQRAVRMKLQNLGVNPVDHFKDHELRFQKPQFVRLPHPEASYETRAMEERFLAVIQALEILAGAAPDLVVPASFKMTSERLIQVTEASARQE